MGHLSNTYVRGCGGARYPTQFKNAIRQHNLDYHSELYAEVHRKVIAKLKGEPEQGFYSADDSELVGRLRLTWQLTAPAPRLHSRLTSIDATAHAEGPEVTPVDPEPSEGQSADPTAPFRVSNG